MGPLQTSCTRTFTGGQREDFPALSAVITDFRLARADSSEKSFATISGSSEVVGTPAYMAPEQVEGAETSTATDIYSFGLVTGGLPFEGGYSARSS